MEIKDGRMFFDDDERLIAGLPDSLPLAEGTEALQRVRAARGHCQRKVSRLIVNEIELVADPEIATIPAHVDRINSLNGMENDLLAHTRAI